jgi:glucosamine-phosphate N-acetyltransferase
MRAEQSEPPAAAVVVRDLEEADLDNGFLDALAALAPVGLTAAQARAVFRERPPTLHTYVAVWQGRVVGTASLLVEPKFIHAGGRVGHIEDVAVSQTSQQHGAGSALVRHAVEQARRYGCYKVILNCAKPLAAFYERLGFRSHDHGLRLDLK